MATQQDWKPKSHAFVRVCVNWQRARVSAAATVKKNDSACFPLFKRIDRRTNGRIKGGMHNTQQEGHNKFKSYFSSPTFPSRVSSVHNNENNKKKKAKRISHISNSTKTFITVNQKLLTYSSTGWARNSLAKTSRIFSPTHRPLVNVVKVK